MNNELSVSTPIGLVRLVGVENFLTELVFLNDSRTGDSLSPTAPAMLERIRVELAEYFSGRRRDFSVALRPEGTEFQQRVWKELLQIPFGETRSYGEVATAIGAPNASRAVGAAIGRNPIPIIIPCHRVIGADGSLTGFSAGLPRKRFLLALEQGQMNVQVSQVGV